AGTGTDMITALTNGLSGIAARPVAASAPQSWPITTSASVPPAAARTRRAWSISAPAWKLPSTGIDDGAYPRMNGATTRQPDSASRGAILRHPYGGAAKPCMHTALAALPGPHVSAFRSPLGPGTSIHPGSAITTCRDDPRD